ncbi:MAG: YlxR family protein [Pseudolysinimonas sp.]
MGCRTRAETSTLLRVVSSSTGTQGGEVVPDPSATLPGRGAWVHPTVQCVELAAKRRAFGRALRVSTPLGIEQVMTAVGAQPGIPNQKAD